MAATNPALFRYDGTYGVNLSGDRVLAPTPESWQAEEADRIRRSEASMARHNRLVNIGRIASVAPLGLMFAPGGIAAAGGGAGAAAGAGSVNGLPILPYAGTASMSAPGAVTAANVGRMATLGKIFSSPGMELGVNTALSLVGQHSAKKAADQARADQLAQYREGLALERQRLEMETRNADLDREDARALNAAINELKKRELDAAEEERAFTRGLVEARETRLAPYRNVSAAAMQRLASMWGLPS